MWSYYGSKSKVVNYYPTPIHDKIIEPFAGSARYSLKYWEKDILLIDKYDVIVRLWKWLQQCSPQDILSLPELKKGECLNDFNLTEDEKMLMGFIIKGGSATPGKRYSGIGNFGANQKGQLKRIADNLFKIKHWNIQLGSYEDIPNESATWFIDPPYQFGGEVYKVSSKHLDYKALADWCMERDGQVIVCENTKADWMPFVPMKEMQGSKHRTTESIWSNLPTEYDSKLVA